MDIMRTGLVVTTSKLTSMRVCVCYTYLLGVCKTDNDLCLIELGISPLHTVVKQRQYNFPYKAMNGEHLEREHPLVFDLSLTRLHNPKLARCINILASLDHIGLYI